LTPDKVKSSLEDLWSISGFNGLRFLTLVNEIKNSAGREKVDKFAEMFDHIGSFTPYAVWRAAVIGPRMSKYVQRIPFDP